jgi:hypothetical protein
VVCGRRLGVLGLHLTSNPRPEDVFSMIDPVLLRSDLKLTVAGVFICHAVDLGASDHQPVVGDLVFKQPHP